MALSEFLAGRDTWPTYEEFIAGGAKGLRDAVKRIRGPEWWAAEMGLPGGDRPRGGVRRWDDITIRAALARFLGDRSKWPTQRDFRDAGYGGLLEVLRHHGGARRWADEMGVAPPAHVREQRRLGESKPPREPDHTRPSWTEKRIAAELSAFLSDRTQWPRHVDFVAAGRKGVYLAVRNAGGPEVWARRMGVEYVRRRGGLPKYWTEERVRERLGQMLDGHRHWPTSRDFEAAGEGRLLAAVHRLGGVDRWMTEFGVRRSAVRRSPPSRPPLWTDASILTAISPLVAELGRWPTKGEFRAAGLLRALAAVYDHGGTAVWQRRLDVIATPHSSRVPDRTRWDEGRIEDALRELCQDRSEWPSFREFEEFGALPLYRAASKHGGISRWRNRLGL